MKADSTFDSLLSDWKGDRLDVACGIRGRNGDYRSSTIRTALTGTSLHVLDTHPDKILLERDDDLLVLVVIFDGHHLPSCIRIFRELDDLIQFDALVS